MPQMILKEAPDVDFYVSWSTVVDAPAWWGDREGVIKKMKEDSDPYLREDAPHHPTNRLKRINETGTSALWVEHAGMRDKYPEDGSWDDDTYIYQQQGILTRANLFIMVHRMQEHGYDVDISDLLKPLDAPE